MGEILICALFGIFTARPASSAPDNIVDKSKNVLNRIFSQNRQDQALRDSIEIRMRALKKNRALKIQGVPLLSDKAVSEFYENRQFQAAWMSHGYPDRQVKPLLIKLREASTEGLDSVDYHTNRLETLSRRFTKKLFQRAKVEPQAAVDLEILLTDASLTLGRHILYGQINPRVLDHSWHLSQEEIILTQYLQQAVLRKDVVESLEKLQPAQPEYARMKSWLVKYRSMASQGRWKKLAAGQDLKPGSRGERVARLCQRLKDGGDLDRLWCPENFDPATEKAVKRFQARHGLDSTGTVDRATLNALNVPVQVRIGQIKVNLEWWRWLPRDLGTRHIRVNIPNYSLEAYDSGRPALSMRVVVGAKHDSTPVFSDKVVQIVLNPYWYVPASITRAEILPKIREDTSYLSRNRYDIMASNNPEGPPIRPDTIDWSKVDTANFPYTIRQAHGPDNALGKIKFVLANPFDIYLHDTPNKENFEKDKRTLSHGCIRVENPLELALFVLKNDRQWDKKKITEQLERGEPVPIRPSDSIPVHILYWTAWVDVAGDLQFRPDVYEWSKRLAYALKKK